MDTRRSLRRIRALVVSELGPVGARVALFGSYARGTAAASSDVDLAVELPPGVDRAVLTRLRTKLEESTIPLEVELVNLAEASEALRREVEREGVPWI